LDEGTSASPKTSILKIEGTRLMKRKTLQLGTWIASVGIITCLLTGCAWSIGGGHKEHGQPAEYAQPTRGQELIDLKKARDQGAITEDEYQAQKKRVLGQ
jgi:hypothetical protein